MVADLAKLSSCIMCPQLCKHRIQVVGGIGPTDAKIMLLGEAPGADESIIGEPFVGRCGQLLDKILADAGLRREELYITNTVKCRPTKSNQGKSNRPPSDDEIIKCKSWLWAEIQLVKPKVIVTLGRIPANTLLHLKTSISLGSVAGKEHKTKWEDIETSVVPSWHPSYLLVHRKDLVDDTIEHLKFAKGLV